MDQKLIESLLVLAKKHGVKSLTTQDISFELFDQPMSTLTSEDAKDVLSNIDNSLPPDLRTDAVNSNDQVLLWSAGQSYEPEMPLTGDGVLNGPSV